MSGGVRISPFSTRNFFSVLPMKDALDKLYLPEDIREGLLDPESPKGKVLALLKALENDDWGLVDKYALMLSHT